MMGGGDVGRWATAAVAAVAGRWWRRRRPSSSTQRIVTPRRYDRNGAASRSSVKIVPRARGSCFWSSRILLVKISYHVGSAHIKRSFVLRIQSWLFEFGFHCVCGAFVDFVFHQLLFQQHVCHSFCCCSSTLFFTNVIVCLQHVFQGRSIHFSFS